MVGPEEWHKILRHVKTNRKIVTLPVEVPEKDRI